MKALTFFLAIILCYASIAQSPNKLHFKSILADTHNDVLTSLTLKGIDISSRTDSGHSDLDRWKEGGVDVQFFSIWTGEKARRPEGFYKDATEEIDSLYAIIGRNPTKMVLAKNYKDVKKGIRQKKLVSLIGVEGGHMIEADMNKLETLYQRGMRYMTLTWNNSTAWASSAMDETRHPDSLKQKGLTAFGKDIVRRMNERGIIVDLSHTGEQTFYDAIATSTKPVILSHSSVWSICPVFRNVKDDQIRAVAKNGGVICINFYSGFISKEYDQRGDQLDSNYRNTWKDSFSVARHDTTGWRKAWENFRDMEMNKVRPSLAQLVDHIDYIARLVGADYVGIGSDFDGVSSLPVGIDNVTSYPKITAELKKRGYSNRDIKKILGGNVMRVMKANFI
ncbi:MAG TPA: dipeptidase [Chitinophagaceae bacterium]|nr:dipeptidase [Chitinophagaceae bacterium]